MPSFEESMVLITKFFLADDTETELQMECIKNDTNDSESGATFEIYTNFNM